MLKFLVMMKRKPGMSLEAYREHYENSHAQLAVHFFGHLWTDYQRHYIGVSSAFTDGEEGNNLATSFDAGCPYDSVATIVVRDQAAMDEMNRILALPETRRILAEDEERFVDRPNCRMMMVDVTASPVGRS